MAHGPRAGGRIAKGSLAGRRSPSHTARFVAGVASPAQLPPPGHLEIAFAGRSNVGKSSLLNRLVGHHGLARVSKTPGRTQQINFYLIDERLVFVDLPGYGFALVPLAVKAQWRALVEGYLTARATLGAAVVLVDLRRPVAAEDEALLDFLQAHRIPAIVVATKADKLAFGERTRRAQALSAQLAQRASAFVVCSSASGAGIEQLWSAISEIASSTRRPRQ